MKLIVKLLKLLLILVPLFLFLASLLVTPDMSSSIECGLPRQFMYVVTTMVMIALLHFILRAFLKPVIPYFNRITLLCLLLSFGLVYADIQLSLSQYSLIVFAGLLSLSFLIKSTHKTAGIESCVCVLCIFFFLESLLQAIPADAFVESIRKPPPLALADRTIAFYDEHNYKGKKPCAACPIDTRIITTGGSSTYGVPLYYSSAAYPSQLDALLHRRHPRQSFEVLNAGVAGHGITQIYYALEHHLLDLKPDIVTINCWFNDSSPGIGWYGLPHMSDREAFQYLYPLWKLQETSVFRWLHEKRLYAIFRFYLVELKKLGLTWYQKDHGTTKEKKRKSIQKEQIEKRRLSPEEYEKTLTDIVKRLKEHSVIPVLVFEPLHHSHQDEPSGLAREYFSAIKSVSDKEKVLFVNPLKQFKDYQQSILFHDFIHPNVYGHELLADILYKELRAHPSTQSFFTDSFHPIADTKHQLTLPYKGESTLLLTVLAPHAKPEFPVTLDISLEGNIIVEDQKLSPGTNILSIPLAEVPEHPLVRLSLRSKLHRDKSYYFPNSTQDFPVQIKVYSGGKPYGWYSAIHINNEKLSVDSRGYTAMVLDGESGEIVERRGFDTPGSESEAETLLRFMEDVLKNQRHQILVLSVRTDGFSHINQKRFEALLKDFGGSGRTAAALESFAFIGSNQLSEGVAFEAMGPRFIALEAGNSSRLKESLIQLQEASFSK